MRSLERRVNGLENKVSRDDENYKIIFCEHGESEDEVLARNELSKEDRVMLVEWIDLGGKMIKK